MIIGIFAETFAQPNGGSPQKPQLPERLQKQAESVPYAEAESLFQKIKDGIQHGSVSEFSQFFGSIVYVTLLTRESDYFSPNQAEGILSNFFSTHKSTSFSFSRVKSHTRSPYATGRFVYVEKGKQESIQIYVLLNLHRNKWIITQFNIY
ncbi:MAG: DUF4783 domain-containing protein [Bacteroidota bacterium]